MRKFWWCERVFCAPDALADVRSFLSGSEALAAQRIELPSVNQLALNRLTPSLPYHSLSPSSELWDAKGKRCLTNSITIHLYHKASKQSRKYQDVSPQKTTTVCAPSKSRVE